MPPKKAGKKDKGAVEAKTTVEVDPGELQQQAYVRQSLQSNIAALKERLKALDEDNEGLRKTRAKVCRVSPLPPPPRVHPHVCVVPNICNTGGRSGV